MKVLVIGGGGREHALAWKLAQSSRVQTVYVAPGNAGTAAEPQLKNVAITDLDKLAEFALAEKIGLTVVGPEAALAAGAVDIFRAKGLRIFGPTKAAAQLESSKAFAKAFMQRHAIPTAGYAVFEDAAAAHAHIDASAEPVVVKADGLAAGKGVVVAATRAEAHAAIDAMLGGVKGGRVVIEEFLEGEEASFMVVCDGSSVLSLATSQDHKRIGDGDTGPNTGGMGAYSPAPVVTPELHARVMREIMLPALAGMAAEGLPFTGFLYAGLMIDGHGAPKTRGVQPLPPRRPRDAGDPDAAEERSLRGADAGDRARSGAADRRRRAAVGPPRRPRRGDGRGRLSGRAQARRPDHRAAGGEQGREGVPCRHRAARRPAGHRRRPGALRHRAPRRLDPGGSSSARTRRCARSRFQVRNTGVTSASER